MSSTYFAVVLDGPATTKITIFMSGTQRTCDVYMPRNPWRASGVLRTLPQPPASRIAAAARPRHSSIGSVDSTHFVEMYVCAAITLVAAMARGSARSSVAATFRDIVHNPHVCGHAMRHARQI